MLYLTGSFPTSFLIACEQAPSKGGKKFSDQKRDSVSEASGSRSKREPVRRLHFSFSQTFTHVSIKQLDFELKISVPLSNLTHKS